MNNKIKKYISISIVVISFCSFFFVNSVSADAKKGFGEGLQTTANGSGYTTKSAGQNDLLPMISLVINIILSLLGVIFLGLVIYGGFIWMIAKGNEQEVQKAKKILQNSIIGLLIILVAYAVTILFDKLI